jgi:hypothetical protein
LLHALFLAAQLATAQPDLRDFNRVNVQEDFNDLLEENFNGLCATLKGGVRKLGPSRFPSPTWCRSTPARCAR